jgi:hypothetical protein
MKKYIVLTLVTVLSSLQLDAQSPQGFNYQATVRNNAGELLVNQNANFQFTIVQGSRRTKLSEQSEDTEDIEDTELVEVSKCRGDRNARNTRLLQQIGSFLFGDFQGLFFAPGLNLGCITRS